MDLPGNVRLATTRHTPRRRSRGRGEPLLPLLMATLALCAACGPGRSHQAGQLGPCVSGQTVDCVPPDLVVQYPASIAETQLSGDLGAIFQTKAEVEEFHGAVVQADYARHRLVVAWPKDWSSSQQRHLIQYLRSQPGVQAVDRT
jgi:hypothetical protein